MAAAARHDEEQKDEGKEEQEEKEEEEGQECSVCLGEIEAAAGEDEKGAVLLVCTHIFHGKCLNRWEEMCKVKVFPLSCPMCRASDCHSCE